MTECENFFRKILKLFSIFFLFNIIKNIQADEINCLNYFERETTILCYNLGLDEFPRNITEQVQYLDLSKNNLRIIPSEIGRLVELKYLNLAKNKLRSLPEEFGELWKLERLDLSQNDIHDVGYIGVITRLPVLKMLYLRNNPFSTLENLENGAVRALDVSHCSIKNITRTSLIGFPELVSLNLAGNPLKILQNIKSDKLKWLDLSSCMLNYLVPDTFGELPLLEHLKISNNPTLVFSTRKETLTHSSLKKLEASGCGLDRPGLHGLPSLTHVTLSQNVIHFLPDRIFTKNPAIIQLNLSGNGLSRLNASSLVGMPKLEHLDLSANNLEHLPSVVFRDNLLLTTLNLSYNDLRNFPTRLTTSAVGLDLSENLIETLANDSLISMWRIKSLDLSRNRLEKFDSGISSKTLTTLSLEGNRLTKLSNGSFRHLPELKRLDLSGNRLTEGFSSEVFIKNAELQTIRLHDNPWRCDCDELLSTYLYLIQPPRKTSMITLICHSPSNVSGYTWSTACGKFWTQHPKEPFESNKTFAIAMLAVLLAFFAFGSAISIGHTIKAKRRQAELRLREAERAEARERLILHRRSREIEAERARREHHEPRIHPSELLGPPTYEEAVEMPRLARSLDNLDEISEGLGQSQQSLAWERKRRMQSRKRAPKRAQSENDLLSRRDERVRKSERVKSERSSVKKSSRSTIVRMIKERGGDDESGESDEPGSDVNGGWHRTRRTGSRKKKRPLMRRDGHSSDDEDSDKRKSTIIDRRGDNKEIKVIELPREPRSGRYMPSSPSLISSVNEELSEISRSKIV